MEAQFDEETEAQRISMTLQDHNYLDICQYKNYNSQIKLDYKHKSILRITGHSNE